MAPCGPQARADRLSGWQKATGDVQARRGCCAPRLFEQHSASPHGAGCRITRKKRYCAICLLNGCGSCHFWRIGQVHIAWKGRKGRTGTLPGRAGRAGRAR